MNKQTNWRLQANCSGMSTLIFFPAHGEYEKARKICNECEVRIQCLQDAMSHETDLHGMFGGLTPPERYALKQKAQNGITTKR
jgi:WhiB family redox-sensing transcriptional regulator